MLHTIMKTRTCSLQVLLQKYFQSFHRYSIWHHSIFRMVTTVESCVFVLIVFVLTLGCCLLALTMKIDKRRKEGRNNRVPMRQPDGNDFIG